MPYFKDSNNQLHFLDDTQYEHLLPIDCVEITNEEAEKIRIENNPIPNPQLKINAEARAYLASTDWMITRMAENGTPVEIDVLTKRQQARNAII